MKKFILIFAVSFLVILIFVSNGSAVIFASDIVYLFEDGKRIKDNSVIWKAANERDIRIQVCEGGSYYRRQVSDPNKMIFFKMDSANVLTKSEWWALKYEDRSAFKNYSEYLQELVQGAIYSKEITFTKATDKTTHNAPKNGMTGGTIGSNRRFSVDIGTGEIKELRRHGFKEKTSKSKKE